MKECRCERPARSPNPRNRENCVNCGLWLNPEWANSDPAPLYDKLRWALFPTVADEDLPPGWLAFRAIAEHREEVGRGQFGFDYLARDNIGEAFEEAGDAPNYGWFRALQARRAHSHAEAMEHYAVLAAQKFYEGFEILRYMRGITTNDLSRSRD